MKVELQTTGSRTFFSRPNEPITVDVCALDAEEREALRQLVRDARFFELPTQLPAPLGADDRTCHITIEEKGRRHTVSVNAAFPGPALQRLIARVQDLTTA